MGNIKSTHRQDINIFSNNFEAKTWPWVTVMKKQNGSSLCPCFSRSLGCQVVKVSIFWIPLVSDDVGSNPSQGRSYSENWAHLLKVAGFLLKKIMFLELSNRVFMRYSWLGCKLKIPSYQTSTLYYASI